ncbi:uncharacterized protein Z519_04027 [Cladophialophora bantiana CBS 173.52]|uniref:Glutathione S-transferase kappa n=1 Tax=Cladophialophora bantiana (strain ATCC 10958 / CBS 173.52 / CDC B-1940 / NIH 8579) TaxID=1442370 RepID=A0A0D2HPT7_CLAB1|nr:uncharacterized protein Z519_04027 [Cladophialophora bantiana CBS 173.52]KIW95443.1 hypothetical protein Z519_04027 [Cladophialophora bantiana CBS 173.52]
MAKPKLTLYFDLHSPYSYLAFYVIKNSPVFKSCDITYTPVLLVAYINAVGLKPPWSSPNKVKWMHTDVARWCQHFNIPWSPGLPANYPFKVTTLKRALVACLLECPDRYPDVVDGLYHAFWYEKRGVQLPEIHGPIIAQIVGKELAARILDRSTSDEVKSLLKQNTDSAIANGSPGLPWIKAVNGEGQEEFFWGFDHLGQVARFLGLPRLNGPHL